MLWLAEQTDKRLVRHISHQADWLTGLFTRLPGHSDVNNCLKTGYDPIKRNWPDWLDQVISREWLPVVHKPGAPVATIDPDAASLFGLPKNTVIVAGTTDSHAAILATGIRSVGDAVTSLGSTLVTKIISPKPIFNSEYGIYSQPFGDNWLVGGASNSGGAVLRKFFSDEKMLALSQLIDAEQGTELDYYPLLTSGERFPINDPAMQPRLSPRPDNEALFFQGMLEGIAKIEQQAYQLLHKLGAPYPASVRTVGGGAINKKWTRIRAKFLDVDMLEAEHTEAAYGSALLAKQAQLR
jgi:sugar (pentulose or hexulose) kinase